MVKSPQNGVFSMLPFLCMWLCMNISGQLADMLITRRLLSLCNTRKLMGCSGQCDLYLYKYENVCLSVCLLTFFSAISNPIGIPLAQSFF